MLRARQQQLQEEKQLDNYRDELRTLRITLSKTANDLAGKKAELAALQRQLDERNERCEMLTKGIARAKRDAERLEKKQLTAEEREQQLARLLQQEQAGLDGIMKEVEAARADQFKAAERVKRLKDQHTSLEQEIRGGETANEKTQGRIRTLEKELGRQGQLMYQLDFQISDLERKLQRLDGKQ